MNDVSKLAGASAVASVLLVIVMPDAASTRPLERHFGADNSCYQRVYSKAHLKKQSTQRVAEIRFDHFPTTFGMYDENDQIRFDPNTGAVFFSMNVRFRDSSERFSNGGTCYPEGRLYRCQVSCDGGSFYLKDRSAKSILLINKTGFAVSECDSENFRVLEPEPDDKIFRLDRLAGRSCTPPDTSALLNEEMETEVASAGVQGMGAPGTGNPGWASYENGLFGWQIEYPANLLAPLPLTDNNAARGFRSADGAAELIVYGGPNDFGDVGRYRKFILGLGRHQDLTYGPVGEDWFVLSGYRANRIFYEKYVFSEDREMVHAFALEYPRDQKDLYNEIAAQMSHSFTFHALADYDPDTIATEYQAAKEAGILQAWDQFLARYGHVADNLHVLAAQTVRDTIAAKTVRDTIAGRVAHPARTDQHPDVKRAAAQAAAAAGERPAAAAVQPKPANNQLAANAGMASGRAADWTNFTVNKGAYTAISEWGDVSVRPECAADRNNRWRFFFTHARGDLRAMLRFEVIYPNLPRPLPERMVPMKFGVSFGTDEEAWQEFIGGVDIFCSAKVQMRFFELEWFTAMGHPLAAQ